MRSSEKQRTLSFATVSLVLLFMLPIFFLDFFSKAYIHNHLSFSSYSSFFYPYGGIGVFHDWLGIDFSINYVGNKGAAWGMLASLQGYLLAFRLLIISGMLVYLLFFNTLPSRTVPLMLVITGASGNVVDFFRYGYVVDMFHFVFWGYSFPIFNIADSAIFCGILWLLLHSYFTGRKASQLQI